MNKIKNKLAIVCNDQYMCGDLFKDREDNLYILGEFHGSYFLLCLSSGLTWNGFHDSVIKAIEDCVFVSRDATITVK